MIKWLSIFLVVFFIANASFAQKGKLIVEGKSPDLYLIHVVEPKENFYSIGRLYNVTAKDLASYNNLQFGNGLSVGESVKIPLTKNNFLQSGTKADGEALIPVYHPLQPKEGLYRTSINYNKVSLESIKKWNHLQSDDVSSGTPLIVGYLKVNKTESAFATKGVNVVTDVAVTKEPETKPIPVAPVVAEPMPPVKKPDANQGKKDVPVVTVPQANEQKTVATSSSARINFPGGYFKKLYDDQVAAKPPVDVTGSASTFKSTSGWQDGKYYCFNNDAPVGAIIKVTDTLTNKSVYAKVLDAIPDIKQNDGLTIIISNAAAEELGATDKFDCTLSYVK